jgi:hypothetical protein
MSIAWYYMKNGAQTGPVTADEIKALINSGAIKGNTLIWHEGLPSWLAANTQSEFASVIPPAPPPPPPTGVKLPAKTLLGDFVEKVLRWFRAWVRPGLLEKILEWCKSGGHYAVLVGAALVVLVAIFWAIKLNQFSIALAGLAFVIAIALGQFAATRFLDAGDRLLRASPTRMASPAFPDCVALIWVLMGLGTLFSGIKGVIAFEAVGPLLAALLGAALFLMAAMAALHPASMNIEVTGASGGEEAVGLLAFFPKVWLRIVPALFALFAAAGVLALLFSFSERGSETVAMMGNLAPGVGLMQNLAGGAPGLATGAGLIVVACFVPIVAYAAFLVAYLIIDLARAILVVPSKLDDLRR